MPIAADRHLTIISGDVSVRCHPTEKDIIKHAGVCMYILRGGLNGDQIRDALVRALPAILEARMQGYEYQSDFAPKFYGQGLEQGLRTAVVALARTKLEDLSDDDLTAIDAISDQRVLTALVTSLGEAHNASEARAALDGAVAR